MRLFALLLCSLAYAQEFDVASIKATEPLIGGSIRIGPPTGGPGTNDPTHFSWPSATIQAMLLRAYDVKSYQISGPALLTSERFDIAAVLPAGTTKEQFAIMWRNLLEKRFGVKVRIEKKEFQVDDLVIVPRGHKLTETPDPNVAAYTVPPGANAPVGKDGKLNGAGFIMMTRNTPAGPMDQLIAVAQPLARLVDRLSVEVGHPVVDKTGLTGKYDFTVDYARFGKELNAAPAGAPMAPDAGVDLATAVQQQLGLRLEKGKGMLDYIVVEKAERVPSEN